MARFAATRGSPGQPLPRPAMQRALVAIDTETALPGGPPHLLEVAAVRIADGEATGSLQRLVRPQVPISEESARTHGITEEDLSEAVEAPAALADLRAFVGTDWLLAHDARADARVLGFEFARAELEAPTNPLLDTLRLSRRLLPDAPDHSLPTLVDHLELEGEACHRALPDAVYCWKVFEACLERAGGDAASWGRLFEWGAVSTSIANAGPQRPRRRPSLLRRLDAARREDEAVSILYGTDGEPPTWLDVHPRLLYHETRRDYLEAECSRSGLLKTYRLDRVQRVQPR